MRRLCFVLVPLVLGGCSDPDFNRPEWLNLPRILALQAEPPQPSFGAGATLRALIYQPPPKTDAAACAAAVPGPHYQWSWCPMPTSSADGYACPMQQEQLDQLFAMLGVGAAPSLDLGTGETATLINPFPAAVLHGICKGEIPLLPPSLLPNTCRYSAGDDPKKDLAGSRPLAFPVTVMLKYTPPCDSPPQEKFGPTLAAVLTVYLSADETVPPNQNPVVRAIYANPTLKGSSPVRTLVADDEPDAGAPADAAVVYDGGMAYDGGAPYDGGVAYDGGGAEPDAGGVPPDSSGPTADNYPLDAVVFPRQKRVGLWLDVPIDASEYLPRPSMRDVVKNVPEDMRINHFEQLDIAWFTEAGDLGGQHGQGGHLTGYDPSYNEEVRPAVDEKNFEQWGRQNYIAFPLHEDYQASTSRFIVVVRDNRGGVTWTSDVATMEGTP